MARSPPIGLPCFFVVFACTMPDRFDDSDRHPVRQAFTQRPLFFGLEMRWIGLEICFTGALAFALGFSVWTAILVVIVYYGLHRTLKWATAQDQQALDLFVQSMYRSPYYQAHPRPEGEGESDPPTSVPTRDS